MARAINRLSAKGAATCGPGLHADGRGLYLRVEPGGARRWIFIFRFGGKRCEMGLGPLQDVPLAKARILTSKARCDVREGLNPIEVRRKRRLAGAPVTFGDFANGVIDDLAAGWRNPKHRQQWRNTLANDAASLRNKPIADISVDDVLGVLKPIWSAKPETARRLRGRIERVLDAARVKGLLDAENPARWKGHLSVLLPQRKKADVRHHPALPYVELPAFMSVLRQSDSVSALALELAILTAARTSEIIGARHEEFDLSVGLWTVPSGRMKMRVQHRVPLPPRAVEIVQKRIREVGTGFIFPGIGSQRDGHLSNMAMAQLLKQLGYTGITVHGFRSCFRDWAGDLSTFPREVAEAALAHRVGDATEQAYRRTDALNLRRQLMERWATYCSSPAGDSVLPFVKRHSHG